MLRASDLESGQTYVHTRPTSGLGNRYYLRLDDKAVARLVKRLRARTRLDGRDQRTLCAAVRGDVVLQAHARRLSGDGERIETTTLFGLTPTEEVRLRAVKHKPGYTSSSEAAPLL